MFLTLFQSSVWFLILTIINLNRRGVILLFRVLFMLNLFFFKILITSFSFHFITHSFFIQKAKIFLLFWRLELILSVYVINKNRMIFFHIWVYLIHTYIQIYALSWWRIIFTIICTIIMTILVLFFGIVLIIIMKQTIILLKFSNKQQSLLSLFKSVQCLSLFQFDLFLKLFPANA